MAEDPKYDKEKALELFHQGENYYAYRFFGAHKTERDGKSGAIFRVWAPSAKAVSVVCDVNNWDSGADPCERIADGIWERFIPDVPEYMAYKFAIVHQDDSVHLKADPYAFHSETNGKTASKIYWIDDCFSWSDDAWYKAEASQGGLMNRPLNIYEVHLGSWKRFTDGNYFSYRKMAEELIPYVKSMGYTHIELMPITEYPLDASWGYQVTGYFSITSRFGTPADFMYFVNEAHKAGIGVLADWVPAHFPKDDFALARFDGSFLYEDPDPLKREHKEWGTLIFNFGRAEIQSFLTSSAMMLLKEYHIDGLRVDAVAAMLYLDYGKQDGEWRPNEKGGKENTQAIAFLQKLNHAVGVEAPQAVMIAEESTAWPLVTRPPEVGGLGFHYKWNMGWMNDTLDYICTDPLFRKGNHGKLTFPLMYAFSENYVLPISHDEVVYGKKSLIDKMPGEYEQKFAGMRGFLTYMISQPGKKLMFMGNEFGQFSEWQFAGELDWMLLQYETHRNLQSFTRDLNHFYLDNPCMWEQDDGWDGFKWINADDADHNIVSYRRIAKDGTELIFVVNFAPVLRNDYQVGVPCKCAYTEIFNSDDEKYGGSGVKNSGRLETRDGAMNGEDQFLSLTLPPLGAIVLKAVKEPPVSETKKVSPEVETDTDTEVETDASPVKDIKVTVTEKSGRHKRHNRHKR